MDDLGTEKWSAGPAGVVVWTPGKWVVGALVNNQWSFAGANDRDDVNQMLIQPFVNYNIADGWYLVSAPIATANWEAERSKDIWTVPVGGGVGRLFRLGKLPINVSLQAFDNVEKPEFGADWELRPRCSSCSRNEEERDDDTTWHPSRARLGLHRSRAGVGPSDRPAAVLERRPGQAGDPRLVRATTEAGSPDFVAPEARLATFDQDGTLWVEHPIYSQVVFAFDRVVALAPEHPEWKEKEPFKTVLSGDREAIGQALLARSRGDRVRDPCRDERRGVQRDRRGVGGQGQGPSLERPYTELVYQPMQEVLSLLRANGYRTYIVTGGGQAFVRAYAERVYGIGPAEVIGSTLETSTATTPGQGVLLREPKLQLNNNNSGKPEDIHLFTGQRPRRRSATRPATGRCWSGPRPARASGWACWSCTTTPSASTPTARPGAARHQGRHLHPGALDEATSGLDRGQHEGGLEHGVSPRSSE